MSGFRWEERFLLFAFEKNVCLRNSFLASDPLVRDGGFLLHLRPPGDASSPQIPSSPLPKKNLSSSQIPSSETTASRCTFGLRGTPPCPRGRGENGLGVRRGAGQRVVLPPLPAVPMLLLPASSPSIPPSPIPFLPPTPVPSSPLPSSPLFPPSFLPSVATSA